MASTWARQLHEFRYPGQGLEHHNRSFCCGWFPCTIDLAFRVEDCLENEDSRAFMETGSSFSRRWNMVVPNGV